ncbi:MAG: GHKL domain-containing protein [Oscillospiraceae bacterium]|nr:GHKL domain-containing protein [Oscillospiraceae bacterium]
MIKKLRIRFVFIIMLIMTVFILTIVGAIFFLMRTSEIKQSYDIMEATLSLGNVDVPNNSPDSQPPENNDTKFGLIDDNNMYRNCILISVDWHKNFTAQYQMNEPVTLDDLKEACNDILDSEDDDGIVLVGDVEYRYLREVKNDYRTNIVLLDRTIEKNTLNRLLVILLSISGTSILIVLIISISLARWATNPIKEAWEKQKRFVADASHELKTPLTVIEANMDVVQSNPESTIASQEKWLDYIRTETERMSKLVYSLLYIAKTDSGEEKAVMKKFNISETVVGVCLVFESLVFEKGRTLETAIASDLIINGDEDKIKQLVTILVDNALKHSDEKGRLYVTLDPDEKKGRVRLIVANTGEAIPHDAQEKVFERFYRVDKSRARNTGGSGLGLSIAKGIVDEHGGKIDVYSSDDELTRFVVIL